MRICDIASIFLPKGFFSPFISASKFSDIFVSYANEFWKSCFFVHFLLKEWKWSAFPCRSYNTLGGAGTQSTHYPTLLTGMVLECTACRESICFPKLFIREINQIISAL